MPIEETTFREILKDHGKNGEEGEKGKEEREEGKRRHKKERILTKVQILNHFTLPSRPAPRRAERPHLESWSSHQAEGQATRSHAAKPSRSPEDGWASPRTRGQEVGATR